ncbi:phage tail protein [Streptomyces sp. NPDC057101]|uniref:phage tail protein n=1 Tax=Streptomyces sp. NPDC057101 TaxID=3346020 RepID=UPI003631D104
MTKSGTPVALSAAAFKVSFAGNTEFDAYFSELSGITSEVEPVEYIAADSSTGEPMMTKQFGKVKPPTVTLKRGVDGSATIFAWHELARGAIGAARLTGTLEILGHKAAASDTERPTLATYYLHDAWPSKIEVGNLKAGASEIVIETVTFTCSKVTTTPM